jgi:glucose-6-phosphate 1-dehydrogenase
VSGRIGRIGRILLLGGTGDLVRRFLAPALAELSDKGQLDEAVEIVGVSRDDLDAEGYRECIAAALRDAGADPRFAGRFGYAEADATDVSALKRAIGDARPSVLAYLALPPAVAGDVASALAKAELPEGSRIAVEKPFGEDLASARALNALLAELFDADSVFRVDHFLGMASVRRLRDAIRAVRSKGSARVTKVEITWDETLALEGRASYYDGVGALKDMAQNHLLQVLAMIACDEETAKRDVLRRTRVRDPEDLGACVVRAQYEAYREEDGVDASSATETFIEMTLDVDLPRWKDVPFVLRSGKALARDRHEVALSLDDGHREVFPLEEPVDGALSAYACVMDGLLRGDDDVFVGPKEAEEQWRVVEPIVRAFDADALELETYEAGSEGPRDGK